MYTIRSTLQKREVLHKTKRAQRLVRRQKKSHMSLPRGMLETQQTYGKWMSGTFFGLDTHSATVGWKPNTAYHPEKAIPTVKKWWWKHHVVGNAFWTGTRAMVQGNPRRNRQTWDWCRGSPSNKDNDYRSTAKATLEWSKNLKMLEWSSQRPRSDLWICGKT